MQWVDDDCTETLKEQKAAEERDKQKQAALAKLTAQERELLGL